MRKKMLREEWSYDEVGKKAARLSQARKSFNDARIIRFERPKSNSSKYE